MQIIRQEKSQIKQNILLYLRNKNVSEYKFYKESGITRGILQQPNGISEENLSRFLDYASDVNSEWLLTGKGEMLKTKNTSVSTHAKSEDYHSVTSYRKDNKIRVINKHNINNSETSVETDMRPRIPIDAAAGALSIAMDGISDDQCEFFPVIPAFPKYDFTIVTRGDSMEPEFHSGDELACAFVSNSRFIQWGRPHVLDTAQGVVLKRIFDDHDNIRCKSINELYPDFSIPKDEIYHVAIVVGLIRQF